MPIATDPQIDVICANNEILLRETVLVCIQGLDFITPYKV